MNPISARTLQLAEISSKLKPSKLSKWEYAVPALAVGHCLSPALSFPPRGIFGTTSFRLISCWDLCSCSMDRFLVGYA